MGHEVFQTARCSQLCLHTMYVASLLGIIVVTYNAKILPMRCSQGFHWEISQKSSLFKRLMCKKV